MTISEKTAIKKKFGKNLRRIRIEKGYKSLMQFYVDSGIDKSRMGKFERGEIAPTVPTLFELAEALNIAVTDLLVFKEKKAS